MTLHAVLIQIPSEPQASACAAATGSEPLRNDSSCATALEQCKEARIPSPSERVQLQRESARIALRESARLSGVPLDGWTSDRDGAPLPNAGFHWSISHKRQYAAAVVAPFPIGIDIEQITSRRNRLWDQVASANEWQLIGPKNWRNFYYIWSAKEAVLKATYVGLQGLSSCRIVGRRRDDRVDLVYRDQSFTVRWFRHDDHVVALTDRQTATRWHVMGIDPTVGDAAFEKALNGGIYPIPVAKA